MSRYYLRKVPRKTLSNPLIFFKKPGCSLVEPRNFTAENLESINIDIDLRKTLLESELKPPPTKVNFP